MRQLTTPLNLPAPGRSQTLYVVFDLAESCVFSKQSLGAFHCDLPSLHIARILTTASTPSSEVTVLICRVPSRGITHAPWNTLPVYLCRFTVRSPFWITIEVFLGSMDLLTLRAKSPRHHLSRIPGRICLSEHATGLWVPLMASPQLSSCVTPSHHGLVQEC